MKKLLKSLRIILLAILILVIAAVILINIFADSATKAAIESAGTKALSVGVRVKDVDLSIIGGKIGLQNLAIDNPPGYQHDRLLELKDTEIAVDIKSFLSDVVHIKDIKLNGVNLVLEQKGVSNNLQDLIKAMPSRAKSDSGAEPSGKKLHIDNLEIANVTAKVKLLPVPGKEDTVTLKLSPIKMTNLGSDDKLDLATLSGKIVLAIASGIAEQGAGVLPKDMIDTMTSTLGKTIEMGKEIIGDRKDIGEEITKGLKDLLKPKKEK